MDEDGSSSEEVDQEEASESGMEDVTIPFADLDVPFAPESVFAVRDSTGAIRTFRVADGTDA